MVTSASDSAKGPCSTRGGRPKCWQIRDRSPGTAPKADRTIEIERLERSAMTDDLPPNDRSIPRYEVLSNTKLSADVHRLVVRAPRVAAARQPGQFVIVRLGPGAERIPLTIADSDSAEGSIVLVIQAVGKSTSDLVALAPGDRDPRHRRSARSAERSRRRWHRGVRGRRGRRGRDASRSLDDSPSSAPR